MAELQTVSTIGTQKYEATFTDGGQIKFGTVKEPPVWRVGDVQKNHYVNRRWWVILKEDKRHAYIFNKQPIVNDEVILRSLRYGNSKSESTWKEEAVDYVKAEEIGEEW